MVDRTPIARGWSLWGQIYRELPLTCSVLCIVYKIWRRDKTGEGVDHAPIQRVRLPGAKFFGSLIYTRTVGERLNFAD